MHGLDWVFRHKLLHKLWSPLNLLILIILHLNVSYDHILSHCVIQCQINNFHQVPSTLVLLLKHHNDQPCFKVCSNFQKIFVVENLTKQLLRTNC